MHSADVYAPSQCRDSNLLSSPFRCIEEPVFAQHYRRYPGFVHILTKASLYIDGLYNSLLLDRKPRRTLPYVRNEERFLPVVHALKACANQNDLDNVDEKNCYIPSNLITMYAKGGALAKAQQVLDELPISTRNVVIWNALIAGYTQQGKGKEALKCFDSMQCEGHWPNDITFACALKACGSTRAGAKGEQIHRQIIKLDMLKKDVVLGGALVDMYVKCGALEKAQQVLDELPVRDVITWNTLIGGYAQLGQGEEALRCFDSMQYEGHFPDEATLTCVLKAFGSKNAITKVKELHQKIASLGLLEKNSVLGNTLVDVYCKCGALEKAKQVFNELPLQDVITWNALISGYAQQGQGEEALQCFDRMQHEGHSPSAATFTCALQACGSIGAIAKGEQIHNRILSFGMLWGNIMLGNALVDMYARCGALKRAQQVLYELPMRNVVTWTVLLAGYAQHEQGEEALICFDNMLNEGHCPNAATFTCALKACGTIGAVTRGEQMHDSIMSLGMLEKNIVIGNMLIDMYGRCGALAKAQQVFDQLFMQNVVAWTVLIAGYAIQGEIKEALNFFERMLSAGVRPGSATLVCMLNACSHSGLLDHAEMYFARMGSKYGITPNVEHCCSMIDLLGRAGKLEKALIEIEKMFFDDCLPFWVTLLGASSKWRDVKMGMLAFKHVLQLDKVNGAAYVSMANIYTVAGIQEHADKFCLMCGQGGMKDAIRRIQFV